MDTIFAIIKNRRDKLEKKDFGDYEEEREKMKREKMQDSLPINDENFEL